MHSLLDYSDKATPISVSTTGAEVYTRFETEPETFALAVVDAEGVPVGIVDRTDFFLRMGAEFGRALFGIRPITYVMRPPRIAHADVPVMDFLEATISVNRAALLDGFIVVDDDNRYVAVGTPLSLISAGFRASKARIRELAAKSAKLARAERKAQAASRAKSQFLAIMSHEIRTPLNGVLAVAEIIERKLQQAELQPYVSTILDSGRTLHRLLTDVLDLSRVEAGAMDIAPEPTDIIATLQDLEHLWRPLAQQKGLEIQVAVRGKCPTLVLADHVRVKQVLNNLVGNAIKFTDRGRVAALFEFEVAGSEVRFRAVIEDTGSGIAPAQLERVFEPFAKADEHRGGAGLGLAICRRLMDAMGGDLVARSTLGQGSSFALNLSFPTCVGEKAAPMEAPLSPGPGICVLVVDDHEANRLVACTMLEMADIGFVTAVDGLDAVEQAQAQAFDVILMDVKMPRLGGVEATRAIRALEGPNRDTPILAVTANADPSDAAIYAAAGMAGVVTKPITAESLLNAVCNALQTQVGASRAA